MTSPHTMIQQRIIARVKELGLTPQEVTEAIDKSELYGEFRYGTYRNLVTENFEHVEKPRTMINKQLVIAFSEALNCSVSDLATEYEMRALRDVPYRRAQWPKFLLEAEMNGESSRTRVPAPGKTANILRAYMQQMGPYSIAYFAKLLSQNGYHITGKQLTRAIGDSRNPGMTRRYVTYEMCEAAARVFQGPLRKTEFEPEWLINCREGRCPHCDPRLISL